MTEKGAGLFRGNTHFRQARPQIWQIAQSSTAMLKAGALQVLRRGLNRGETESMGHSGRADVKPWGDHLQGAVEAFSLCCQQIRRLYSDAIELHRAESLPRNPRPLKVPESCMPVRVRGSRYNVNSRGDAAPGRCELVT